MSHVQAHHVSTVPGKAVADVPLSRFTNACENPMRVPGIATRRRFLRNSATCLAESLLPAEWIRSAFAAGTFKARISAHIWVYASAYPPKWDAYGEMERIFSDLHRAGLDGVEVMEVNLRHYAAVEHRAALPKT